VNNFICTRFQLSSSSPSKNRPVILAFTPGFGCWYCEQQLSAGFCGVHATQTLGPGKTQRYLFITCCERCQRGALKECDQSRVPAQAWTGPEVRDLLDSEENIAGVLEGISVEALSRRTVTETIQ
jgi:hypothetical protein